MHCDDAPYNNNNWVQGFNNLIKPLNKLAESDVLCCSQQNRDLLDLHIVVTDFFFQPTWPVEFEIQPVAFLIRWRCEFGAMLAGYRQQPGCLLLFLLSLRAYNLGCNSVGTDTNVTTMLKCFATMVYHNIAHDILMSHQFRRLQIWLLQLHIRKQMATSGEFCAMLAVWNIASNQVACYCSCHCFMLIICLCFKNLYGRHYCRGQRGR